MAKATSTGSINTQGFIERLNGLDFSYIDCIQELVDNAIDANASEIQIIHYKGDVEKLYIIDNGKGMNIDELSKYFIFCNDKSEIEKNNQIGSKGMGGKIGTILLSNRGKCEVFSKQVIMEEPIIAYVDWSKTTLSNDITVNEVNKSQDKFINKLFTDYSITYSSYTCISIEIHNDVSKLFSDDIFKQMPNQSPYYILAVTYSEIIEKTSLIINMILSNKNKYKIKPFSYHQSRHNKTTFPLIDYKGEINSDIVKKSSMIIEQKFIFNIQSDTINEIKADEIKDNCVILDYKTTLYSSPSDLLKDILIPFAKNIFGNINVNEDNGEQFIILNMYGCHFVRNGKFINTPVIQFKEMAAGDFWRRDLKHNHVVMSFNTNNKYDVDHYFGIMVNKSRISGTNINKNIYSKIKDIHEKKVNKNFISMYDEWYDKIFNKSANTLKTTKDIHVSTTSKVIDTPKTTSKVIDTPKTTSKVIDTPKITSKVIDTPKTTSKVIDTPKTTSKVIDTPKTTSKVIDTPIDIITDSKVNISTHKTKVTTPKTNNATSKRNVSSITKESVKLAQNNKESYTGLQFNEIIPTQIDHNNPLKDDGTNNIDNLQALTPNLHHLKTYNKEVYDKIIANPKLYNAQMALAYMKTDLLVKELNSNTELMKATKLVTAKLEELSKQFI
jgi:hypothetical protein